jgi:hypothetical protein
MVMQEIAPNIFIDHNALGLVTGVVRTDAGSVLVDSPSRHDDARSWRSGTAKLVMGEPKFLISLDTNYDRILSAKGTECVIITHANTITLPKVKSSQGKTQDDGQSEADSHDQQSNNPIRWNPPEIVFESTMSLHLGGVQFELEHHAGSNMAGVWVILPLQKVIFVGDSVVVDQPPFLAYADLELWQEDLKLLASRTYKGYQIVSSRSGVVGAEQVKEMTQLIAAVVSQMQPLVEKRADLEAYYQIIPKLMNRINCPPNTEEVYFNRLRWGITTWYEQHQK